MEGAAPRQPTDQTSEAGAPLRRRAPGRGIRATPKADPVTALRSLPVGGRRDSGAPSAEPDRPVPGSCPHNLPHQLTSFVGREREIAEIRRLLGTTRLLTLTGTGGVGKTRLGHEVAASLLGGSTGPGQGPGPEVGVRLEDGAWLVELAALGDAALVPQAVVTALGVPEDGGRSLTAALIDALRPACLLLILDNCEHLIDACAELSDTLLRACPSLRVLATSRQPLGIAGETTFRVPSLALPSPPDSPIPSAASADAARWPVAGPAPPTARIDLRAEAEAVRLFVDRARAAVPELVLTADGLAAARQICRRLDGIPLAIELAASRVASLSPEQIAARLGDRFGLLTGGSRTALPRYRTLRALIDWSHDLLDERERTLFRRLAVFAGGWALDPAEAVCAGEGLARGEILDLLSRLAAKSLVIIGERDGEVRYRFLESLREYAAERLRESGEEATLRARHCEWLLVLAERAEPELRGPHSTTWVDRLERERENLRAALGWCIERGDAESGLRLGGALARFWGVHGPYREVHATLTELLASPGSQESAAPIRAARAKALYAVGHLALRQGDSAAAEACFQELLEIARELGDRRRLAIALYSLGYVARFRADYPTAHTLYEEARQVFAALDDSYWLAQTHQALGVTASFQGDVATARALHEASLTGFKELGDQLGIMSALNELGEVVLLQGEIEASRSLQWASLEIARRIEDHERIAMALAALAQLAAAQGQSARALRLAAAATALNDATGQRNAPAWHQLLDRWLEPARRDLGAEACEAAWEDGLTMPLREAIEYALSSDPPATSTPMPHASETTSGLTQRELEVASLVAGGLSNRQIAARLVIAEGTATNHVKHILTKLAFDSRVQIAAWAIGLGLNCPPGP